MKTNFVYGNKNGVTSPMLLIGPWIQAISDYSRSFH